MKAGRWLGDAGLLWRLKLSSTLCAKLSGFVPCLLSTLSECAKLGACEQKLLSYLIKIFWGHEGKAIMTLARRCLDDGCFSKAEEKRP